MKFFLIFFMFINLKPVFAEDAASNFLFIPLGDQTFSLQDYAERPANYTDLVFDIDPSNYLLPLYERPALSFSDYPSDNLFLKDCGEMLSESTTNEMRTILRETCGFRYGSKVYRDLIDFRSVLDTTLTGQATLGSIACEHCDGDVADFTESVPVEKKEAGPWQAPDITSEEACNIEGMNEQAKANCVKIFADNKVPKNAFLFALDGLKRNSQSFQTNKCFDTFKGKDDNGNPVNLADRMRTKHQSMGKMREPSDFSDKLDKGIPNKCTMILNDYDDLIKTHGGTYKCKAAMYYIDMCASKPSVTKTYSYVGYGTCKGTAKSKGGYTAKEKKANLNANPFHNASNHGTSLLGFSVTGGNRFTYGSQSKAYKAIRKQLGGRVPATPLFGFQNSNNGAAVDFKYLHVGAYTSAGCPSIDPKYSEWIDKLADDGPSVVVGYKEGKMEGFEGCE
jgi:hypothetical protein